MSDAILPAEAIELLVNKVVAKFSQGDISFEEAAVRLLGTGRFEEKPEAADFLRTEVCPQIEEQLKGVESEIARLQAQANLLRNVLGLGAPQTSLLSGVSPSGGGLSAAQAASAARAKKEKAGTEKKRRGAASESTEETRGDAPVEVSDAHESLESAWSTDETTAKPVSEPSHDDDTALVAP